MAARFELNHVQLNARFKAKSINAAFAVAEQIKADCEPLVPKQERALRDTATVEKLADGAAVKYNQVYAAYQYYGCWPDGSHKIKNTSPPRTTPGTTTQWIEHARRKHEHEWNQIAQNAEEKL